MRLNGLFENTSSENNLEKSAMSNPLNRETMKASDIIRAMDQAIKNYGDLPVYFTDGYFRYGLNCRVESVPNFDTPTAIIVQAFGLLNGGDGTQNPSS